ncbi:hypothetical protein OK016_28090 [Vibrio chagasii]|nr:hypothetical protein [Vibrio chagasii]
MINQNIYRFLGSRHLFVTKSVKVGSVEDVRAVHQQLFGQLRHNQLVVVGDIDPRVETPSSCYQLQFHLKVDLCQTSKWSTSNQRKLPRRCLPVINNVNSEIYLTSTFSRADDDKCFEVSDRKKMFFLT